MRHDHLVVTVSAETRDRIQADCDEETVWEWVRDAIERKLDSAADVEFVDDCAI